MTQLRLCCSLVALLLAACGSPESAPPEKGEPTDASLESGADVGPKQLTPDEKAAGLELLFDGRELSGFEVRGTKMGLTARKAALMK